jgi:AmmeMemoRadiSam system protein A
MLDLAEQAIRQRVNDGSSLRIDSDRLLPRLHQEGACFVTLHRNHRLRGCIGSLEPRRPLMDDLVSNAEAAAFSDPRFSPLRTEELDGLELHVSLIGPSEPIECETEQQLLEQLEPGVDGLILSEGYRRATFLPSVWEQLPEPGEFVEHLKVKAGLPRDYWSQSILAERYHTFGAGRPIQP